MLAALLLASTAWAHDADVLYVLLTEGPGGTLDEVVTLTAGTLSLLAPVDADSDGALSQADLDARAAAIGAGVWDQMPLEAAAPCVRKAEQALVRDGYVELAARFECPPGQLTQDFKILRVLSSNYRVVLGRQLDAEAGREFAQGNVQRLIVRPRPAAEANASTGGFAAGVAAIAGSPGVTIVWLLSLLWASSLAAAGVRVAVLALGNAAVGLGLLAVGWIPPGQLAALAVAGAGVGLTFFLIARGNPRRSLQALGLLAALEGLSMASAEPSGGAVQTLAFHAGRSCLLLGLSLVWVPVARIIARRPALKARAVVVLGCVALFAFGFSLIQTAHAF